VDSSRPEQRERPVACSVLASCGFTENERPKIAAVRIPMGSEYRDFWELPCEPAVKTKLVLALIRARTILALVRNLTSNRRRRLSDVRFIPREGAGAQLEQIGGSDAKSVVARAQRGTSHLFRRSKPSSTVSG
jgi:hypothetical protein